MSKGDGNTLMAPREVVQEPAAVTLGERAIRARDARLALLVFADRYAAAAWLSHREADECFAVLYNAGLVEIDPWIKNEVKALAARTLRHWRKLRREAGADRLAVDRAVSRRGCGVLNRANDGAVKLYVLSLLIKQPKLSASRIRALVADRFETLALRGRKVAVPPLRTFQWTLRAWRKDWGMEGRS